MNTNSTIEIYTDGACRGNPGPGSYAVIILKDGNTINKIAGHRENTTNNEMELGAIYVAVLEVKRLNATVATIYTDSKYAINSLTKWSYGWRKNRWFTKEGNPVKNQHILRKLVLMLDELDITFIHVPGHSGHKYNEIADEACNALLDQYYPHTINKARK